MPCGVLLAGLVLVAIVIGQVSHFAPGTSTPLVMKLKTQGL